MELKFRAWHKEEQRYYKVLIIDLIQSNVFIESINGDSGWWVKFHEVIIEEYTGLKDKKDKEIYVGDILEMTFINDYAENITVEGVFSLAQWKWENVSTVEVIGNTNKNKELLK